MSRASRASPTIADELLEFFGDGQLIAHNAPFDFGFLNAELARLGLPPLDPGGWSTRWRWRRRGFPGMPNSLDALCRRFEIDLSARTTHNALLDCRLLAEVYVELTGGRQRGLSLADGQGGGAGGGVCDGGAPRAATDHAERGGVGGACGTGGAAEGSGVAGGMRAPKGQS